MLLYEVVVALMLLGNMLLMALDLSLHLDMHLGWAMALQWVLYFNLLYLLLGLDLEQTLPFAYAATASFIGYDFKVCTKC